MHSSKDEQAARIDFGQRYSVAPTDVLEEIERRVIGDAWGANGFTTVAQADLLIDHLDLAPGMRLLDVGTGRGWPGLYLAARTGSDVVLTDLPIEGLRLALERAEEENVRPLGAVVSSGKHLPFGERAFDAITHTDVLC